MFGKDWNFGSCVLEWFPSLASSYCYWHSNGSVQLSRLSSRSNLYAEVVCIICINDTLLRSNSCTVQSGVNVSWTCCVAAPAPTPLPNIHSRVACAALLFLLGS